LLHFDQPRKDRENYEIISLDIGRKRAMFQKYKITWLGLLRFVAYALDA